MRRQFRRLYLEHSLCINSFLTGKNPKQTGGHAASRLNVSGIAAGRQIEQQMLAGFSALGYNEIMAENWLLHTAADRQ